MEGSPTKIDYIKKGYPYSNRSTGGLGGHEAAKSRRVLRRVYLAARFRLRDPKIGKLLKGFGGDTPYLSGLKAWSWESHALEGWMGSKTCKQYVWVVGIVGWFMFR